jgi:hypothetical protein
MNFNVALPDPVFYEVERLGLPANEELAIYEQLRAALKDFVGQDGVSEHRSMEVHLPGASVFVSYAAKIFRMLRRYVDPT